VPTGPAITVPNARIEVDRVVGIERVGDTITRLRPGVAPDDGEETASTRISEDQASGEA